MAVGLQAFLEGLRSLGDEPDYEPEIDEKDRDKDKSLRETLALQSGAVRKAVLEPGTGGFSPKPGDLVYIHYAVKTADDEVLYSTYSADDGSGIPQPFVLGKGMRMPRGWEIGIQNAQCGERFMLILQPSFGFEHPDCKLRLPLGSNAKSVLHCEIQLLTCYPQVDVSVVNEHEGSSTVKRRLQEGKGWETPRPPFEVTANIKVTVTATNGQQQTGPLYFATESPLTFTLGSPSVPNLVEVGLSSMARGEQAVISGTAADATSAEPDAVLPVPPADIERVELELELLQFTQVRDLTGDGHVMKRRIRDGIGEFPIDCPIEDSRVWVHYKVLDPRSKAVLLDTRAAEGNAEPQTFETGMGMVPEALDLCVRIMTVQEMATVTSTSTYAYDGRSYKPEGLADGADVVFEVELIKFDKQPSMVDMPASQRIVQARTLKDQGNTVFKKGVYGHAKNKWLKSLKILGQLFDVETDEEMAEAAAIKASCMVNLALCAQREDQFSEALSWCTKALREDPDHPKALFRQAAVRSVLGDFDEAEEGYRRVAEVDPLLQDEMQREIARMRQRQKAAASKQKREFQSFFGKRES